MVNNNTYVYDKEVNFYDVNLGYKNLSYYCLLIPFSYNSFAIDLYKVYSSIIEKDKLFNTYINDKNTLLLKINNFNKIPEFYTFIKLIKTKDFYIKHYLIKDNVCIIEIKIDPVLFNNFINGNYSKLLDANVKGFWIKSFYNKYNNHPILFALTKSKNFFRKFILNHYNIEDLDENDPYYMHIFNKEFFIKPNLEFEKINYNDSNS